MSKNRKVKQSSRAARPPRAAVKPAHAVRRGGESGPSREIVGIVSLGTAIFIIAALLSLQAGSGTFMGPFGRTIASVIYGFAGLCSYGLAAAVITVAVRLLMDRAPVIHFHEGAGLALGLVSLGTLMHLIGGDYRVAGHGPGGLVGEGIAEVLRAIISTAGTALLAVTGVVVTAVIVTPLRMRQVGEYLGRGLRFLWAGICRAGASVAHFCGEVVRAVLPEREHDEYLDEDYAEEDEEFVDDATDPGIYDPPIIEAGALVETGSAVPEADAGQDTDTEKIDAEELAARLAALQKDEAVRDQPARARKSVRKVKPAAAVVNENEAAVAQAVVEIADEVPGQAKVAARLAAEDAAGGPVIVESQFRHPDATEMRAKEQQVDAERLDFLPLGKGEYKLPPVHLLDYDDSERGSLDRESMLELSAKLTQTLENYGVKGEVVAIRPGPVVTMYEFSPTPGTRINKIVNLSDDLAMVLEAMSVRIVAPIPGKAAVGIEVPNKTRETVYRKEILADDVFQKAKRKLPLALGKNIDGAPQVVDLAKMPHLLVAGTTGSGKSVAVNSMITSLLYSCTPEEVRMIMVDPKMLELSIYEGIPHLLLPVVTDPKKANLALRWSVDEMERRYDLLATMGVRDLATYNQKIEKMRAQYEADKLRQAADAAQRLANGDDDDVEITEERDAPAPSMERPPERLPYIVIVIDEFADLMMCAPKEVETSVARIAQKARAAGIHLILATQRPSVDVITGLIKANFPSRAAFRVASKVDSRTILDQGGAEALLGSGDMLFSDRGASPCRFHGCYVDEEEIARVVSFLATQGKPVYNMDIIKPREEDEGEEGEIEMDDDALDAMYDRAVALVAETRQVSISMIQRRLRVGYNRAARMVEHMERTGVVSPPDHTNKREVLVEAA
jgi:DNA segregation ATPase FtsK/SpoIIIE, S-DNA-T family